MTWTKGKSGNPGGRGVNKAFADALRLELAAAGNDQKALREIARNLIDLAKTKTFDALPAINAIADRLDGKPAQESTVTFEKRDASDWSMEELDAILDDARASRMGEKAPSSGATELN